MVTLFRDYRDPKQGGQPLILAGDGEYYEPINLKQDIKRILNVLVAMVHDSQLSQIKLFPTVKPLKHII